jgi:hypothetical protein
MSETTDRIVLWDETDPNEVEGRVLDLDIERKR